MRLLQGNNCSLPADYKKYIGPHFWALWKVAQDAALYYNQAQQLFERLDITLSPELDSAYMGVCIGLTFCLVISTQFSFSRFIYRRSVRNTPDLASRPFYEPENSLIIFMKGASAFLKAYVKTSSIVLQLTKLFPQLTLLWITLGAIGFIPMLLSEFSLFKKAGGYQCNCVNSNKMLKLITAIYSLGTGFTYATSLLGFFKHIDYVISDLAAAWVLGGSIAMASFILISTIRFVYGELLTKYASNTERPPFLECTYTYIEQWMSALSKSFISATSLAALFFTVSGNTLTVPSIAAITVISTLISYWPQLAGVTPNKLTNVDSSALLAQANDDSVTSSNSNSCWRFFNCFRSYNQQTADDSEARDVEEGDPPGCCQALRCLRIMQIV